MGLVSWIYLHCRVDVHSGTRTHYCSLQTISRSPLSYRVLIATCKVDNEVVFEANDNEFKSQIEYQLCDAGISS
ncbi:unnamed protein product [Schistosoma mattheei]|uniref:Uncharacterized protein n=1 Tax=Schistosoma mattheei TaxID=31246 RepID=A0A3P8CJB5_9TREM|nr:unnamed protein product [Schistosoma mattheei]